MNLSDWIALGAVAMSFCALMISGISYIETRRMADASDRMASSSEQNIKAAYKAVDIAERQLDANLERRDDERMARFRVYVGEKTFNDDYYDQNFIIENFGKHAAYGVGASFSHMRGGIFVQLGRLEVDQQKSINLKTSLGSLPNYVDLTLEDGLGKRRFHRTIHVMGVNSTEWELHIENPPDGRQETSEYIEDYS